MSDSSLSVRPCLSATLIEPGEAVRAYLRSEHARDHIGAELAGELCLDAVGLLESAGKALGGLSPRLVGGVVATLAAHRAGG